MKSLIVLASVVSCTTALVACTKETPRMAMGYCSMEYLKLNRDEGPRDTKGEFLQACMASRGFEFTGHETACAIAYANRMAACYRPEPGRVGLVWRTLGF